MIPESLAREWTIGIHRISHETPRRMRIHRQEERDEEVMRVPEGLEALLPDLRMRRGVHEQHAQEHDVPGDSTSLRVVYLNCSLRSDHRPLDVEEVDIMRCGVYDGPEEQAVCALSVEPLALVQRQPPEFRSDDSQDIPAHG